MLAVTRLLLRKFGFIVLLCLAVIVFWSRSYRNFGRLSRSSPATSISGENAKQTSLEELVPKEAAPRISLTDSPHLLDVQNSTLGFQKIYVLSMPIRTDKRDALTLSAYMSGLDLDFVDGVNASEISRKAYPMNWNMKEAPGTLGCWRGHMNIYQMMVRDRVQTAMIMEDDVDWDVMIKAQMTELARGTRYIQRASRTARSPYGDGWDIISTGHCGLWNKPNDDQDYWVVENDPTVIGKEDQTWSRKPNLTPGAISGNQSRLIFSPNRFTCTASYAISLQGAARMIYDQQILPNAAAIDMALSGICKRTVYGVNSCLAAYPMITGTHQPAGDPVKSSDRTEVKPGAYKKFSSSANLVFPIRLNLGTLLKGETVAKAQHPERSLVKEIDIQTLQLPRGRPAFVRASEYIKEEEKVKLN